MNTLIKAAALAAAFGLPMSAVAFENNSNYMPGQRFADTFTIESWLATDLPRGDYISELAVAYQDRADYEASYSVEGDTNWYDATAFAAKSMEAAAGVEVQPWAPSVLGIDDPVVEIAYQATVRRAQQYKSVAPAACAQLTALYDHFLEELDEETGPYRPHPVTPSGEIFTAWVGAYKACYEPASIYGFPVNHCENTNNDHRIHDEPVKGLNQRSVAEALAAELGANEASGLLTLIDAVITVEGHASTTASRMYNQRLSECRAGFMRDLMIVAGVAPGRIETIGLGELQLEVPTGDGVEEYRNRRVVVIER